MKKYTIIPIFLAVGVLASGCKKNEENSVRNNFAENVTQTEYVMQDGDTQITGEVTEIIGNEVTLALGNVSENNAAPEFSGNENMPDRDGFPQAGEDNGSPQWGDGEGFPQMGDGEGFPQRGNGEGFPQRGDGEGFSQRGNGEGFPQMGDGENFRQRGNGEGFPQMGDGEGFSQAGGRGRGNRSTASIEKSGETASYIIPVGMTITGASGRNNDYSALSAGMILQLTVNSDGYVVAAEIL